MPDQPAAVPTDRGAAPGPGRSSREAWLALAVQTLIRDGIDRVKIQIMARQLGVSRSSFYWFFSSPQDLQDQMLDHWLTKNTGPIIQRALRPARSLPEAILNVFECWVNEALFDPHLDIAVRLWARRDPAVLKVVAGADQQRLDAITRMFERHGFDPLRATVRARILYFTQVGQYTLDVQEDLDQRLARTEAWIEAFAGMSAPPEEIDRFATLARSLVREAHRSQTAAQ